MKITYNEKKNRTRKAKQKKNEYEKKCVWWNANANATAQRGYTTCLHCLFVLTCCFFLRFSLRPMFFCSHNMNSMRSFCDTQLLQSKPKTFHRSFVKLSSCRFWHDAEVNVVAYVLNMLCVCFFFFSLSRCVFGLIRSFNFIYKHINE